MSHPSKDLESYPLHNSSDQLAEQLAGDLLCPLCGTPYLEEGIHVLRHQGNRWTLSVQCYCCGSGSLITAHVQVSPDLNPGELIVFAQMPPLSEDDVLDIHNALQHDQTYRLFFT